MTTSGETAATILPKFEHAWSDLDRTIKSLSERELTEIRDPAGWAVKDHLMHLATWDRALLAALDGRPRHQALGLDASTDGSEDWDALNAAIFAATRDRPVPDVLDAARATQAVTRQHLMTLASGGVPAGAEGFLNDAPGYIDHYHQHHGWIRELIGRA
jgi:Mycothiol maleylpyruvate isomerase N-terminal domain